MKLSRPSCILAIFFLTAFPTNADFQLASGQPIVGLWGSQYDFGPAVRGRLVIDGRATEWRAQIAGFSVPVRHEGATMSFALPDGQGEFQGDISSDGKQIRGSWIQPPTVVDGYRFWTPVKLVSLEKDVWTGSVCALEDKLTLYLVITKQESGSLTAFIRSPESNFGAHRTFEVRLNGEDITLLNAKKPTDILKGTYDNAADRLSIRIPKQIGENRALLTFDFTRRTRNNAEGFYPRTPAAERYVYRQPFHGDDGWVTASLTDVGLDPAPALAEFEKLLKTETRDSSAPYIQGVLAARGGKLFLEEYFYGFNADRTHDLRSAGKSFTSALVGIAMDRGAKFDLDTPVLRLFPEYKSVSNPDPRKQRITVKSLLTMTSGLSGNDSDDSSPGNELKMFAQKDQPDFCKFALDLPMAREPGGEQMVYFTAGINLLSCIVRNTTGMPAAAFFNQYLAMPLQMQTYHLNLTPTGEMYGGGGLYLRPRDALKLGQLYLNGGIWNGRRVISQRWVDLSTKRYSGYSPEHGYGFAWHLFSISVDGHTYREYEAQGNGGQVINVIPALNLAVMFTTGNYGDDETIPEREVLAGLIRAAEKK